MTPQRDCPGGSVAVDILMPWFQLLEMSKVASVSTPNVGQLDWRLSASGGDALAGRCRPLGNQEIKRGKGDK
jgi:hypothetical protein